MNKEKGEAMKEHIEKSYSYENYKEGNFSGRNLPISIKYLSESRKNECIDKMKLGSLAEFDPNIKEANKLTKEEIQNMDNKEIVKSVMKEIAIDFGKPFYGDIDQLVHYIVQCEVINLLQKHNINLLDQYKD